MDKQIKYHCPVKDCLFSEENGRHFKRKMLIDQHFLNCHAERKFKCCNCEKRYAIDWQLKYHLKTCGLTWKCLTCDKSYKERLSLVTHCKRHFHLLPEEAKRRKSKLNTNNDGTTNKLASLNVILFPIIMSPLANGESNVYQQQSQHQNQPQSTTNQQHLHKPILPKSDLNCNINITSYNNASPASASFVDTSVQTETSSWKNQRRHSQGVSTRTKKAQRATQTERIPKARASRGAQCPPVTNNTKGRKKTESTVANTQTQTLESILLDSTMNESHTTLTKSTWTSTSSLPSSPPAKITPKPRSSRISIAIEANLFNDDSDCLNMDSYSLLTKSSNPLLSQYDDSNCSDTNIPFKEIGTITCDDNFISEQSVQTDETTSDYILSALNDIETQTTNELLGDLDLIKLPSSSSPSSSSSSGEPNENLFFSSLRLNDIETQTIWSQSQTTQTDLRHQRVE